jgi:anti-sigma regulatory factor (Ser/Thr protein kinase)
MRPGHELIKEQIFFRKELKERVLWVIKIRWIFAGLALTGSLTAELMGFDIPARPLAMLCSSALLYNVVFVFVARWLEHSEKPDIRPFSVFAHIQITCDLVAVFIAIYITGMMASPLLVFAIFHIILAGILLPPVSTYLYAGVVLLAAGVLCGLQISRAPEAEPMVFVTTMDFLYHHFAIAFSYLTFAVTILFSAFMITSIRMSLRSKGRSILQISKELETTNARLVALYEMVKDIDRYSGLKELLDSATRQTARLMGVKACSIKLLDDEKKHLQFASTYGLSEDYVSKGTVSLERSPINRRIIEGKPYMIGRIGEEDYFQFPENVQREGIASMLCLPLRGNNMTLGVFCVYGREHYRFDQEDIDFFGLMSDLIGIAVERVKWDLTKSWFIAKVAHNLRAPLGAVLSMVKLVRKGYLGPVNEEQDGTLERCEKRIEVLGELISDLLRLGKERTETGKTRLHPVAPEEVLGTLAPLFESQAKQKGIGITFEIHKPVMQVTANETLIEDLFSNLISNAIKYTPEGGDVRVILGTEDGSVRFEVSDTGIGIPEKDLPRLFTEFFRTAEAKELVEEGTGLGLVIVKEILDRMGGKIHVESKSGEGTHFKCLIPGATPMS